MSFDNPIGLPDWSHITPDDDDIVEIEEEDE